MKYLLSLPIVIAIAGCAAPDTGIVKIADNTYMRSKQDYGVWSNGGIKAELYKDAMDFCAKQGKKVKPLNSSGQDAQLKQSAASAEIQFACE